MIESSPTTTTTNKSLTEPLLQPTQTPTSQTTISLSSPTPPTPPLPSPKNITLTLPHRTYSINHNVLLNLLLAILYGISDSIWSGTVFVAYLKTLSHNRNTPVGNIEAVNGLAVLLSAVPVGYLADRYGRAGVIRSGGVLIAVTAAVHIAVLHWIGDDVDGGEDGGVLVVLAGVMAMWGVGSGIVSGPSQALYADSTPVGERTVYYHYLFVCFMVSSCCGPIVSIVLFWRLGDDWDLGTLRRVCYVGLGMEFLNAFVMMFFDDEKALDEEEGGGEGEDEEDKEDEEDEEDALSPLLSPSCLEEGAEEKKSDESELDRVINNTPKAHTEEEGEEENNNNNNNNNDDDEEPLNPTEESRIKQKRKWIPYIMFTSNLIFAIGSGMTVKFFPLFFKDVVKMSPTEVQCIYLIVPLGLAIFSGFGTRLSKIFGRVQTTLALYIAGISCLLSMVVFNGFLDEHPFVLVPIYVFRTIFMNGTYPLQESILMDFIPKNERGRWKSLESVAQFGWCGSAALGGLISDSSDYVHTFLGTAILQFCAVLIFALLLPLVPKKESDRS